MRGENIGGVTLDLAMAKLARLAMAARGVTLSPAIQPPVAAQAVIQSPNRHYRRAPGILPHTLM